MTTHCCTRNTDTPALWTHSIDPCRAWELIIVWDALLAHCPGHEPAVERLARRTGVSADRLHQARRARIACAHPAEHQLSPQQFNRALLTVQRAWRALLG